MAYYPPPPRSDTSKIAIIIVIVVVLLVAVPAVLAAVLYVMVSGLISDGDTVRPMTLSVGQSGGNWSVAIESIPSRSFPTSTFLSIRDLQSIVVLSQHTFASLSFAVDRATYVDVHPSAPEILAGDSLLIDQATYPAGYVIIVTESNSVTTETVLR